MTDFLYLARICDGSSRCRSREIFQSTLVTLIKSAETSEIKTILTSPAASPNFETGRMMFRVLRKIFQFRSGDKSGSFVENKNSTFRYSMIETMRLWFHLFLICSLVVFSSTIDILLALSKHLSAVLPCLCSLTFRTFL